MADNSNTTYVEQLKASYSTRCAWKMAAAIEAGFNLYKVNPDERVMCFVHPDNDGHSYEVLFDWSEKADHWLDDLAGATNDVLWHRLERKRKQMLKESALSKLTDEEREVLGCDYD